MLCAMHCEIASSICGYIVHVNLYCTCIVRCTELHLVQRSGHICYDTGSTEKRYYGTLY